MLIKKKKYDRAFLALKQLRGCQWADEAEVIKEYRHLLRYCEKEKCSDFEILSCPENLSSPLADSVMNVRDKPSDICTVEETYRQLQNDFSENPDINFWNSQTMLPSYLKLSGIENPSFIHTENNYDKQEGIISEFYNPLHQGMAFYILHY